MECYSAIKNMPFAAIWMDLEIIINAVSQTEKDKYHILLICGILNMNTNELVYRTETDSQP